jgi:hypothetical protein
MSRSVGVRNAITMKAMCSVRSPKQDKHPSMFLRLLLQKSYCFNLLGENTEACLLCRERPPQEEHEFVFCSAL